MQVKEEVLLGERDEGSRIVQKEEQKGPSVFPELGVARWGVGENIGVFHLQLFTITLKTPNSSSLHSMPL